MHYNRGEILKMKMFGEKSLHNTFFILRRKFSFENKNLYLMYICIFKNLCFLGTTYSFMLSNFPQMFCLYLYSFCLPFTSCSFYYINICTFINDQIILTVNMKYQQMSLQISVTELKAFMNSSPS